MVRSDREHEFRLRPNRPPKAGKNDSFAWAAALKTVFRYASTSAGRRRASSHLKVARKAFHQRCAVRITYAKNKIAGQWRAHGRYIARESAARDTAAGFSAGNDSVEPARLLDAWQRQGDVRLWKLIISPEFGDRVDLRRLSREMMQKMEAELGTSLEWVAVTHFNTEHPHVHIALRGARDDGSALDLPREDVKTGIRTIAEDLCTRQIGYRTELDAREAERREINQCRVTSLDRIIARSNTVAETAGSSGYFIFRLGGTASAGNHAHCVAARLIFLQKMGLASEVEPDAWSVRPDFLTLLKAMQQVSDRQKMLAAHRTLISDERLPLVVTEKRNIKNLEGRILGHGEDEAGKHFGRYYLLLEGTDGKIHLIYYTPELETARSHGQLGANSFIRLRKTFENGRPLLQVENFGDSDELLKDKSFFSRAAYRLKGNARTADKLWGGWLGRYQARLSSIVEDAHAVKSVEYAPEEGTHSR